jgi:hypothetical protein
MSLLLIPGLFFLLNTKLQIFKIDIEENIQQIIGLILLLIAYYYYNNEKLF